MYAIRSYYEQIPPELANSTPQERAKALTLVMKEKLALTPEQLSYNFV